MRFKLDTAFTVGWLCLLSVMCGMYVLPKAAFAQPNTIDFVPIYNLSIEPARHPATAVCKLDVAHSGAIPEEGWQCPSCCPGSQLPEAGQDMGIAYSKDTDDGDLRPGVYLDSGEVYIYEVDLEIPGRGFNWRFARKYRSGISYDGLMGHNWDFNYNRRLVQLTQATIGQFATLLGGELKPGDVLRMDGYGRVDRYVQSQDGTYRAPLGFYTQLEKRNDGSFVERDLRGMTAQYAIPNSQEVAQMTALVDRHGNTMRFEHDAQGRLVLAVDTLGRHITYRYNSGGRLAEIEDFSARSLTFAYDSQANLVALTSPSVIDTPNANDFPSGKTTRYVYDASASDPTIDHNLIAIIAPNESATDGPSRVTIAYDNNDRVIRLTVGATDAQGTGSGGTILYNYTDRSPGHSAETEVFDRNGNRTRYQFNALGNIANIRQYTNRELREDVPAFYESWYQYNSHGELRREVLPERNAVEYMYDEFNTDPLQQGNLIRIVETPDPERGGDQASIVTVFAYEPIFNQVRLITEPRGNDPDYVPQNGSATPLNRYTTMVAFDYEESCDFDAIADSTDRTVTEVKNLLAAAAMCEAPAEDLNADGLIAHIGGKPIRISHPTVQIPEDGNMAIVTTSTEQRVRELIRYNQFGQKVSSVDAEGNLTKFVYYPENDPDGDGEDLISNAADGAFGYMRLVVRDAERDPLTDGMFPDILNSGADTDFANIRTEFSYDAVGNIVKTVDPRGIVTEYSVNQLNQVVEIVRASDVQGAIANPDEPDWLACTEEDLVECRAGMAAFGYRTQVFYDHNNNIVRRRIENRDSNNLEVVGEWITSEYFYDILDNQIQLTELVSESPEETLVTEWRYDANENVILELSPVANLPDGHPEHQPSNVLSYVYDERDLVLTASRGGLTGVFREIEAHGNALTTTEVPDNSDMSTVSYRYDANANLVEQTDATDNTGDDLPETTTYLYDGFDRQISLVDAIGNQNIVHYDPAGNVVRIATVGSTGGPSPTSNSAATLEQPITEDSLTQPLLNVVENRYDELNRLIERRNRLFVYEGVAFERTPLLRDGPLGETDDGWVQTVYEYDRKGRQTFLVEDDLSTFRTEYDGADRKIRTIDAESNETVYTYDDSDNLVRIVEIEITSPDEVASGTVPDLSEEYTTTHVYDSLNRLIRTTDNIGRTERRVYDSRDNLILVTDPQHSNDITDLIDDPLGVFNGNVGAESEGRINRNGNTVTYLHDGVNRMLAEIRPLRDNGEGNSPIDTTNTANPDGRIVIDYEWDANSRIVAIADDGSLSGDNNGIPGILNDGNITRNEYDALDRLTMHVFDDGTTKQYTYDADHNYFRIMDQNGSIIEQAYDGLNRVTQVDVTKAAGVIGTDLQTFEYDGLSRTTRAMDNNDPLNATDDAFVTYAYDSLGRILEEVQNGAVVSSQWAGDMRRLSLAYPNKRQVDFTYDRLDRIVSIANGGASSNLVENSYIGPNRGLERRFPNDTRLTFLDENRKAVIGYDGAKRIIRLSHVSSNNSVFVGFEYEYDSVDNIVHLQRFDGSGAEDEYVYDSMYRLVDFERTGIEQVSQSFVLDGVGNWTSYVEDGTEMTQRVNNMNEYESFGVESQRHDDNGNLMEDDTYTYAYDFANRLRQVTRSVGGEEIANYTYDAHLVNNVQFPFVGRRIEGIVQNSGDLDDSVRYIYDLLNVIEEQRDDFTQQYTYDVGLDTPITLDRDFNRDGVLDETFFYHQDVTGHVIALTDAGGDVVERMSYDAYGHPTFRNADFDVLPIERSDVRNPYLFTGRRYDPETGLYYYRNRQHNPTIGRFIQRDPLGQVNAAFLNLENLYTYAANNPRKFRDPLGLAVCLECEFGSPNVDNGVGGGGVGGGGVGGGGGSHSNCLIWDKKFKIGPAGVSFGVKCCSEVDVIYQCLAPGAKVCFNCSVYGGGSVPLASILVVSLGVQATSTLKCNGLCVTSEGELTSMFTSFGALKKNCDGCIDVSVFGEGTAYAIGVKCKAGGEYCIGQKTLGIKGSCCGEVCYFVGCSDWCPIKLGYTWKL